MTQAAQKVPEPEQQVLIEAFVFEIPCLLRQDRRHLGHHHDFVARGKLHDPAWCKQRSGRLLP